jgi:hypothetical protein
MVRGSFVVYFTKISVPRQMVLNPCAASFGDVPGESLKRSGAHKNHVIIRNWVHFSN